MCVCVGGAGGMMSKIGSKIHITQSGRDFHSITRWFSLAEFPLQFYTKSDISKNFDKVQLLYRCFHLTVWSTQVGILVRSRVAGRDSRKISPRDIYVRIKLAFLFFNVYLQYIFLFIIY